MSDPTGSEETKSFYDEEGWTERDGQSVDQILFGVKEDGPIRVELFQHHLDRIRSHLARAGENLNLLECGCGGDPESELFDLCSKYTGIDFSESGLKLAAAKLEQADISYHLQAADVCDLPFDDGSFDALYCAHMIYHLADPAAQEAALKQMIRVLRPGGVAVLIAANPRPLLFPLRMAKRLLSDMPLIGTILDRMRAKPPIPYKPMSIGWMRQRLEKWSEVEVLAYSIPSTHFYQNVTEYQGLGRAAWRTIRWLDLTYPRLSAYLGNYVIYTVRKLEG